MKEAKKQLLPTIAKLLFSTRRASRALSKANALVSKSNSVLDHRRQLRTPLTDAMLASFDPKRHGGEVMAFDPVGRE
ncbi:MAG: hypothetical protein HYY97_01260 [Rhodocyclales bacterium]|nr:hypothetical protein [Rhodocyclales bacterium]